MTGQRQICTNCWYVLKNAEVHSSACPGCRASPPPAGWAPLPTMLAERYKVTDQLGRGGMGAVLLAEDTRVGNRQVAIKLPLPGRVLADLLEAEQRAASFLGGYERHFVKVFATDAFLVMEYLPPPWTTLRQHLREHGLLNPEAVAHLGIELLKGIRVMENHGVVHRDLKPENIFVCPRGDGRYDVKIYDFGIWVPAQRDAGNDSVLGALQQPNAGTPSYMSPEQLRHVPLTTASDIHATGSLLYESIIGQPPYVTATKGKTMDVWVKERMELLRHPLTRPASIPGDLFEILAKALEFDIDKRQFFEIAGSGSGTSFARGMQRALEKFLTDRRDAAERARLQFMAQATEMQRALVAIHGPMKGLVDDTNDILTELTYCSTRLTTEFPDRVGAMMDELEGRYNALMKRLRAFSASYAPTSLLQPPDNQQHPAPPAPAPPPMDPRRQRSPVVLGLIGVVLLLVGFSLGAILRGAGSNAVATSLDGGALPTTESPIGNNDRRDGDGTSTFAGPTVEALKSAESTTTQTAAASASGDSSNPASSAPTVTGSTTVPAPPAFRAPASTAKPPPPKPKPKPPPPKPKPPPDDYQ